MKLLRLASRTLVALGIVVIAAVLVALIPAVQTAGFQALLESQPQVHARFGSVTAGFGRIDVGDAHLEKRGLKLDIPSAEVSVGITRALLARDARVTGLVSRGWTLDLSQSEDVKHLLGKSDNAAEEALLALAALSTWELPIQGTYDGIELEGDVLFPGPDTGSPRRAHLSLVGGGVGGKQDGHFIVDFSTTALSSPLSSATFHGTLDASPRAGQRYARTRLAGDMVLTGPGLSSDMAVSIEATAGREGLRQTLDLALHNAAGTRINLSCVADAEKAVAARWSVDLPANEVARWAGPASLPRGPISGDGRFAVDLKARTYSANGTLKGRLDSAADWNPALAALTGSAVNAAFDLSGDANGISVRALDGGVALTRGRAMVHLLQPFSFRFADRKLEVSDSHRDVVTVSAEHLPLGVASLPLWRYTLASPEVDGAVRVMPQDGGYRLEVEQPLSLSGRLLSHSGVEMDPNIRLFLDGRALVGPLAASIDVREFRLQSADVTYLKGSGSAQRGDDGNWTLKGSGSITIAGDDRPLVALIGGPTLDLTLTGKLTDELELDIGAHVATGRAQQTAAALHASIDIDGDYSVKGPITLSEGKTKTVFTIDSSVTFDRESARVEGSVTSEDADLASVGRLASAAAALAGAGEKDAPFWGTVAGQFTFNFGKFRVGDASYEGVVGRVVADDESLRLDRGRVWLFNHDLGKAEVTLKFKPSDILRYEASAKGSIDDVDAAALLGGSTGGPPPIEGRVALSMDARARANDLPSLWALAQPTYALTSHTGVLRVLKTSVADAIPETHEPVKETIGSVGSAVGSVFGVHKGVGIGGTNAVSKRAESVIAFTYSISEIGYDSLDAAIERLPDGTLRLKALHVTAPEVRLAGEGSIAADPALTLGRRPLHLSLSVSVAGDTAKALEGTGLLASDPATPGFLRFERPLEFKGSLLDPDNSDWHAILAAAATQPERLVGNAPGTARQDMRH
jgi:hypothetical protein